MNHPRVLKFIVNRPVPYNTNSILVSLSLIIPQMEMTTECNNIKATRIELRLIVTRQFSDLFLVFGFGTAKLTCENHYSDADQRHAELPRH